MDLRVLRIISRISGDHEDVIQYKDDGGDWKDLPVKIVDNETITEEDREEV